MTWGELKAYMEKHSMPDDTDIMVLVCVTKSWEYEASYEWESAQEWNIDIHHDSKVVYLGDLE